jgi:hypothetical protein
MKYLREILESKKKYKKERKLISITGKLALNSINVCLAQAPNIKVKLSE